MSFPLSLAIILVVATVLSLELRRALVCDILIERMKPKTFPSIVLCLVIAASVLAAQGQLRIVTWNISNYNGGRVGDLQTSIYGAFEGRTMAPDMIIGQEFLSSAGLLAFKALLNNAPGSPGDWEAAEFRDGADTESICVYRTSKLDLLGVTTVATGSSASNNQPRNTYRYDIRLKDYASDGAVMAVYVVHLKAGSTTEDRNRRLVETSRIRTNVQTLNPQWMYVMGGDFNIGSSSEEAFQRLVGEIPAEPAKFVDPIRTSGSWNNSGAFRLVHTQDPATQMDDRFDLILLSPGLVDGVGFDYRGNPNVPYRYWNSDSARPDYRMQWNDPNHSYRAWGNDGNGFNGVLQVAGNTMVGPAIAQALVNAAQGLGHLPVFLDIQIPPKVSADSVLDFGSVYVGTSVLRQMTVYNSADVGLWTASGIAELRYSLEASEGVSAPAGQFVAAAGASGNAHSVELNTATVGQKNSTVTIHAPAAVDSPHRVVQVVGNVLHIGDTNADGCVDDGDVTNVILDYGAAPSGSNGLTDLNGDQVVDDADLTSVILAFGTGC